MITRIVRLTLKEEKVLDFENFVMPKMELINSFEGCINVRIFKDHELPNVFYTISEWESEENLNNYRKSELFGSIWPIVKPWFNDKTKTYTLNEL
jgi:quinol monooxygenase YgiN